MSGVDVGDTRCLSHIKRVVLTTGGTRSVQLSCEPHQQLDATNKAPRGRVFMYVDSTECYFRVVPHVTLVRVPERATLAMFVGDLLSNHYEHVVQFANVIDVSLM